jgi:hypothetical protein
MTAFQKENIFHHSCNLKNSLKFCVIYNAENLEIVQKFAIEEEIILDFIMVVPI